jgi:hypothetical protein
MCITKRGDHYNPHERIQGIGGRDASLTILGGAWWRAEDDAINDVLRDPHSYYVSEGDHTVWVIVSERYGRKFLTTERDGVTCDNLLHLPECPR